MSEVLEPKEAELKRVKIQPTLRLDTTDLPEIKDYDVGQTYDAVVHCEMVSKDKGSSMFGDDDMPGVTRGTFKVLSIKALDSLPQKSSAKLKAIQKKASNY